VSLPNGWAILCGPECYTDCFACQVKIDEDLGSVVHSYGEAGKEHIRLCSGVTSKLLERRMRVLVGQIWVELFVGFSSGRCHDCIEIGFRHERGEVQLYDSFYFKLFLQISVACLPWDAAQDFVGNLKFHSTEINIITWCFWWFWGTYMCFPFFLSIRSFLFQFRVAHDHFSPHVNVHSVHSVHWVHRRIPAEEQIDLIPVTTVYKLVN